MKTLGCVAGYLSGCKVLLTTVGHRCELVFIQSVFKVHKHHHFANPFLTHRSAALLEGTVIAVYSLLDSREIPHLVFVSYEDSVVTSSRALKYIINWNGLIRNCEGCSLCIVIRRLIFQDDDCTAEERFR